MKITLGLMLILSSFASMAKTDITNTMFSAWLKKSGSENTLVEIHPNIENCHLDIESDIAIPGALAQEAKNGRVNSQTSLAFMLLESSACSDIKDGIEWLKKAAKNGSVEAASELGYGYLHGSYSLELDLKQAKKWLEFGAINGDKFAAYNMAVLHRYYKNSTQNDVLISQWLKKAADAGVEGAIFEYFFRCAEGVGLEPIDKSECKKYLDKAKAIDYRVGNYINDSLRIFYGKIASVKWLLDEDFFEGNVKQLELTPNSIFLSAVALGNMTNTVKSKGIENNTDAFNIVVDPEIGFNYSINLYHIAAQLGDLDAQKMMHHIYSNELWENSSEKEAMYWKYRFENNKNVDRGKDSKNRA